MVGHFVQVFILLVIVCHFLLLKLVFRHTCTGVRRKCSEEGALPDEAIFHNNKGIASPKYSSQ
jgi:hypothetical protein